MTSTQPLPRVVADLTAAGYNVIEALPAGGMSHCLLATSPDGVRCVVKTPLQFDESTLLRFRDEARLGFLVHHPNVVDTLRFFECNGRPFLVVEHIEGHTWAASQAQQRLATNDSLRIAIQVARGLHAVHTAVSPTGEPLHAVHRDVTPSNILVDDGGHARLIDFGICSFATRLAPATATGVVAGTVRFLAPEIWAGQAFSPQADLWALGVCLLESLLGRRAAEGSVLAILSTITSREFLPVDDLETLGVDDVVIGVLRQLLAPRPEDRLTSAASAALALSRALPDDVPAPPLPDRAVVLHTDTFELRSIDIEPLASTPASPFRPPPAQDGVFVFGAAELELLRGAVEATQAVSLDDNVATPDDADAVDDWGPTSADDVVSPSQASQFDVATQEAWRRPALDLAQHNDAYNRLPTSLARIAASIADALQEGAVDDTVGEQAPVHDPASHSAVVATSDALAHYVEQVRAFEANAAGEEDTDGAEKDAAAVDDETRRIHMLLHTGLFSSEALSGPDPSSEERSG